MGWRDRLRENDGPERRDVAGAPNSWAEPNIEATRAATLAAAGQPIDISYITDAFIALRFDAEYASAGAENFEGPAADALIKTYGGPPIGRLALYYGHHVALVADTWLFHLVTHRDGEWLPQSTVLRSYAKPAIVGSCTDGSELWEFRA
jgi:hypothetical protein